LLVFLISFFKLDLEASLGMLYHPFHQHLCFMLRSLLPKPQRMVFNELHSTLAVREFLSEMRAMGDEKNTGLEEDGC